MVSYILRRRKLGRTSAREIARGSSQGIVVYRNDGRKYNHVTNKYERIPGGLPHQVDYVFRWGCTSVVNGNGQVVNKSAAISAVGDKRAFRKMTADAGLAPKTWLSVNEEGIVYPVVLRRSTHAQGRNLHVCNNIQELRSAAARYGEGNYYISALIQKVSEYRVAVVSGRVCWVAKKTPSNPNAVAWNVAQGGRFDNVPWSDWPLKAVKVAIQAFKMTELDFGGVDVMLDAQGNVFVLEINSAPSQTSPYRQSCFTKCFDYIVQFGKDHIPLTEEPGGWKKFIHPALSNEAILAQSEV
jgi:hypothetical protein